MSVREQPEHFAGIRAVHEAAFGQPDEADLVEALRAEGAHVPELCLVALAGEQVVGHIMFSRATLGSGHEVLALAPVGVLPELQRQGIGAALNRAGLDLAERTAFPLVIVVGHAEYYPRFGFEPAGAHGVEAPWDVPPEAWMIHTLPAYTPDARGLVTYAPAFDAVT